MPRSRLLAALLVTLCLGAFAACGKKDDNTPTIPPDAGSTSGIPPDASTSMIPADAATVADDAGTTASDAGSTGDAGSTDDAGLGYPECPSFTLAEGRRLTVTWQGQALDFSGTDNLVGYDDSNAPYEYYVLFDKTGNYALELDIYDDYWDGACPITADLPTDDDAIELLLFSIDQTSGDWTFLAESDLKNSTGKLVIDGFIETTDKEELSLKCTNCVLEAEPPETDDAGVPVPGTDASTPANVGGEVHEKFIPPDAGMTPVPPDAGTPAIPADGGA